MSDETTVPDTITDVPEAPKVAFGFAVLVTEDGQVFVEREKRIFAFEVEREATLIEVRRYTSEILMDLQAQAAAEYVALRLSKSEQSA